MNGDLLVHRAFPAALRLRRWLGLVGEATELAKAAFDKHFGFCGAVAAQKGEGSTKTGMRTLRVAHSLLTAAYVPLTTAVSVALALDVDGEKHVLGLWIEQTEGAKFWLKVMNELKTLGVGDILIAVVDGLKGFPEAIAAVFPETTVQTCVVHLIRNSLAFVSWTDRKTIMPWIRAIYRAETEELARARLDDFEAEWGRRYPAIGHAWRRNWDYVVPFFAFPKDIRKFATPRTPWRTCIAACAR